MHYLKPLSTIAFIFVILSMYSCGPEKKPETNAKSMTAKPTIEKKNEVASLVDEPANKEVLSEPMSPAQLEEAQKMIDGASDEAIVSLNAKQIYRSRCAACHGFNGDLGVNGAKHLTSSKVSLKESVAQVYFGKGLMTPFKSIMKPEEIVAVGKYIETLRK